MVGVEKDTSAPDFAVCDPDGFKKVTLGDIKGKTAVISFFPAAFSGSPEDGCEMQLCGVGSLVDKVDPDKVVFYGCSGDLPFASKAFESKLGIKYKLLSDPTLTMCKQYVGLCNFGEFFPSGALKGTQSTNRGCVIIDPEGKVIYSFSGDGDPGKQPPLREIKEVLKI